MSLLNLLLMPVVFFVFPLEYRLRVLLCIVVYVFSKERDIRNFLSA
jgi:hypothetical protein